VTLKCFIVEGSDDPEDTMIVFVHSHIAAKRRWANEHGDGDRYIAGISAKRAKGWDKYSPGPVPPLEMIEDGWWFECSGCGTKVSRDEIGEPIGYDDAESEDAAKLLPIMAPVEHGHHSVYCHQGCMDHELAFQARQKHYSARIYAWLERRILRRFPDAEIIRGGGMFKRNIHITRNKFGRLYVTQAYVSFGWPTSKIGPATFRIDQDEMGRRIPRNAFFACCNGDREAFEAWAAEQLAVAKRITEPKQHALL